MNHEDIIKLAQEIAAQYSKAERFQTWTHDFMMQRLMELVSVSAAAEREAWQDTVEKMINNELIELIQKAKSQEREACAQIGDGYDYGDRNCGDEIRARGMK